MIHQNEEVSSQGGLAENLLNADVNDQAMRRTGVLLIFYSREKQRKGGGGREIESPNPGNSEMSLDRQEGRERTKFSVRKN